MEIEYLKASVEAWRQERVCVRLLAFSLVVSIRP